MSKSLVDQIPSFLETYLPDPISASCSAILHTELSRDEWFVGQRNGSWTLTGIFDFGDVLIGDPRADSVWREFDLSLLRSYFSGYGFGVSTTTIVFWESGRSAPQGENRGNIAKLRGMGIRDVKALLESI